VKVESTVDEAEDVARVLENARIELRRTLTEVRNEKAWNDQLLESIVEGIVALDRGNHITFFSAGAERITGWNSAQVIGRNCDDLLRPVEIGQPFSTVMPKPGQRKRLVIEVAQGRQFTLAVTGARFAPSMAQESERVFVFRDVSDEEAVHRLLGDFMANVSHEFRTPLSALAASIELLLDQADDLSKSELMELINALHLSILSLGTLVDNLIEGASIETGHFHVSPRRADVGDIIGDAVRVMQPLLDKYHQQLDVELPADIPVVWADPKRATQILVNLLSNASKYSPDHTKISIRVHSRGDWIRVEVADQGPGILPQYRQDIFHRFSSIAPEESEARYGIGLGLSVVKAIAQAHGGQAGVEENDGGGSVFWFTLSRADSK
jgi:PAS domain S-box-containing protein